MGIYKSIDQQLAEIHARPNFYESLNAKIRAEATTNKPQTLTTLDLSSVRKANPFLRAHRNLTMQSAVMHQNPALAAELKAQAEIADAGFADGY